jgi:hypothetical protein
MLKKRNYYVDKIMKNEKINDGLNFIESMDNDEFENFVNDICENLEPDYNIQKIIGTKNYEFQVKQYLYKVEFVESVVASSNKRVVSVKFKLVNGPNQPKRNDFDNEEQYKMALQKSQTGITGTGNSLMVFKKVIGAIVTSIKEIKPDYITFDTNEEKRKGLYNKIIDVIKKYIPFKYKQLNYNPINDCALNDGEFWLEVEQ